MVPVKRNPDRLSLALLLRFLVWMFKIDPKRTIFIYLIQLGNSLSGAAHIILVSRIVADAVGVYEGSRPLVPLLGWIAISAALSFATSFLWPLFTVLEEKLRQELEESLLTNMQDKTNRLRLETFERSDFHDLLYRARRVTEPGFLLNVTFEFFFIFRGILNMITVAAVVAWWNPWLLAAVALVTLPTPIAKWLELRGQYALEKKQIPEVRMRNYLAGLLKSREAAKEVRAFGLGSWLLHRWKELYWRVENEQFSQTVRHNVSYVSFYSMGMIGLAGGVAWCAASVSYGTLSPGGFAAMLFALGNVSSSVRMVFERFGYMAERLLRIGDFFDYMDLEPEETAGDRKRIDFPADITLHRVSFRYPQAEKDAIRDITCAIRHGEKIALIGENGSGKTTLVKLLLGLYQPTDGNIRYGDTDLQDADMPGLRDRIAVVFQDFNRYAFSALENIGLGQVSVMDDRARVEQAAARSGADEVITGLPDGYDTLLTTYFTGGTDLSGGQWQKVAIARAFMREAEIVSLDEPTAALDPKAESDIMRRFLEMSGDKTSFLVSHRMGLARLCDRIFMMKEGRIVEQGTHAELLAAQGEYARLWYLQSQWYD